MGGLQEKGKDKVWVRWPEERGWHGNRAPGQAVESSSTLTLVKCGEEPRERRCFGVGGVMSTQLPSPQNED